MALIQWKQINPELNGNGQLTGSLEITGSFILNGQELDLSGGVVSSNQTLSLNGYELTISKGNTITLPQGDGSADTGSLINSASAAGNVITFTFGDGSTQSITIDTGSAGSTTDITSLNAFTSSYYADSASFDQRILNITGSATDTSGLLTTASYQIDSASFNERISNIGDHVNISNLNTFTQSAESRLSQLESATGSYLTSETDNQTLTIVGDQLTISSGNTITIPTGSNTTLPSGLISSSEQILGGSGILSGSHTDITSLNQFTSSYYIESASFSSRISSINSSGDISFDGNRVVSNTLLGDLYTDGFNAATTGSIQDFLTAVFFPTEAPTATFTNETSNFNTNLATNGTNLVSVALTDTVDNSPYTLVLGGANGSSFTAVATNAASSSWEIQANDNLAAGNYIYDVVVGDSTNATRTYSSRTLTIAQASSGTLSTTGNFYIIESVTTGPIYLNSNGRTGAQGGVTVSYSPNYGSQVATNFSSTNPFISINSTTGLLSVGTAISGSGNIEGIILNSDISWTDQYGNTSTAPINVQVTRNFAPSITFSNSGLRNTNQAISGSSLGTVTFGDTEGDAINYSTFTFDVLSGNASDLTAVRVGSGFEIRATTNLSAGSYSVRFTVKDIHGFNTGSITPTITIASADDGRLTGDSNIYIVESAITGDIFRDATGYNNGNLAQIGVSYSPNYGSQVATLTSSNPAILVDGLGNLTLGVDLSGSLTQSGATFDSTISWVDQYGNTDSTIITANVFSNEAPSALVVDLGLTADQAISGSTIGTLSITDTELNSPYSLSIGGVSGSLFNAVALNAERSSWSIQPFSLLSAGSYPVTFTVTDTYGEQSISSKTFEVESPITDTLYVYDIGQISGTYNNDLGIQSQTTSIPPVATSYTGYGFLEKIEDGELSNSTFTYDWGGIKTATLLASASGANVNTLLTDLGAISKSTSNRFVILIPSGSDMTGVPRTTNDVYGSSTLDEYVLEVAPDGNAIGSGLGTTEGSNIHKITLGSPVNGISDYIMVGNRETVATSTSIELRLIPVSGSAT